MKSFPQCVIHQPSVRHVILGPMFDAAGFPVVVTSGPQLKEQANPLRVPEDFSA
jgi:hypothetical protein